MTILQKIGAGVATGALFASMATTAFADTTATIEENGVGSTNTIKVVDSNSTTVTQKNTTIVSTEIYQSANTGGNTSSFNTGGTNSIETGDATNKATVTVEGGTNVAVVDSPCGCQSGDTDATISGNGVGSINNITVKNKSTNKVTQKNTTIVWTGISQKSKTGNNTSSFNTGGNSSIITGDAWNKAKVVVSGSSNVYNP